MTRKSPVGSAINGLTEPYLGTKPAARLHAYGHTFRWVRGDRYVAVQHGTCVDGRRSYIIRDHLEGHQVLEGHQPLIDAIPVVGQNWTDPSVLNSVAGRWANARNIS